MSKHTQIVDMHAIISDVCQLFPKMSNNHIKDIVINILCMKVEYHLGVYTHAAFGYTPEPSITPRELSKRYSKTYSVDEIRQLIRLLINLTPDEFYVEPPHPSFIVSYKILKNYLMVIVQ